jgi:hypothetical protein
LLCGRGPGRELPELESFAGGVIPGGGASAAWERPKENGMENLDIKGVRGSKDSGGEDMYLGGLKHGTERKVPIVHRCL